MVDATEKYLTCFWARILAGKLFAMYFCSICSLLCCCSCLLMTLSVSCKLPELCLRKDFDGSML